MAQHPGTGPQSVGAPHSKRRTIFRLPGEAPQIRENCERKLHISLQLPTSPFSCSPEQT